MRKLSVENTKEIKLGKRGVKPSPINIIINSLKVGESCLFGKGEWPLRTAIPQFISSVGRSTGKRFSSSTTEDGDKLITRKR